MDFKTNVVKFVEDALMISENVFNASKILIIS